MVQDGQFGSLDFIWTPPPYTKIWTFGHQKRHIIPGLYVITFWTVHIILAWAVCIPVGWRSGSWLATTLVATINDIILFYFLFFSVFYFFHRRRTQIKKTYLAKVDGSIQQPRVGYWIPFHTLLAILGPLTAILDIWGSHRSRSWDVAGGEVLQAVRHCRRWASAPGAARLFLYKTTPG